jgi:hypothetical protein
MSAALFGHHGDTNYDLTTRFSISGTIAQFRFINPHMQINAGPTGPSRSSAHDLEESHVPRVQPICRSLPSAIVNWPAGLPSVGLVAA